LRRDPECNVPCQGLPNQDGPCNTQSCSVDAVWSDWRPEGDCEHKCGSEEVSHVRTCDRSQMAAGGRDCTGSSQEMRMKVCGPPLVYGRYQQWGSWSRCSSGQRSRTRRCSVTPQQVARDRECTHGCHGQPSESEACGFRGDGPANEGNPELYFDEETNRRLADEKALKEKTDDEMTAAKNAERVALGLDAPPSTNTSVSGREKTILRRVNPECVTDCTDLPGGHYGSCTSCGAYVTCTRHGRHRERMCHDGKEFDVAKRKCVRTSQTCVVAGVVTV